MNVSYVHDSMLEVCIYKVWLNKKKKFAFPPKGVQNRSFIIKEGSVASQPLAEGNRHIWHF